MRTFYEWLKEKNRILEGMGRRAMMTHEELPAITPRHGNFVIILDGSNNIITKDNVFRVLNMTTSQEALDANSITLLPWGKGNIKISGNPPEIPREAWKNFVIVNEFLYPKEKTQRFENQPVFMIGLNTQSWIAMRKKEIAARKRKDRSGAMTLTTPTEVPAFRLQALKQQLIGSPEERANDPDAMNRDKTLKWLRGV